MSDETKIAGFRRGTAYLSNFYRDAPFFLDGFRWNTSEHYYQAQKTDDKAAQDKIRNRVTPKSAKRLGRKVELRADWDEVRVDVMRRAVEAKFRQNGELAAKLVETGDAELEEANDWGDVFWGTVDGDGANWLGVILMELRAELRFEAEQSEDFVDLNVKELRGLLEDVDAPVSGTREQLRRRVLFITEAHRHKAEAKNAPESSVSDSEPEGSDGAAASDGEETAPVPSSTPAVSTAGRPDDGRQRVELDQIQAGDVIEHRISDGTLKRSKVVREVMNKHAPQFRTWLAEGGDEIHLSAGMGAIVIRSTKPSPPPPVDIVSEDHDLVEGMADELPSSKPIEETHVTQCPICGIVFDKPQPREAKCAECASQDIDPPFDGPSCRYCGAEVQIVDPEEPYRCEACANEIAAQHTEPTPLTDEELAARAASMTAIPVPRPPLSPVVVDPTKNRKVPHVTQLPTVARIYEHYERKRRNEGRRGSAIGAGTIGKACDRAIWYAFRWALQPEFDGKKIRLFDTGDREEVRYVEELRAIGVTVWATRADVEGRWYAREYGGWHVFNARNEVVETCQNQRHAEARAAIWNAKQIKATALDGHFGLRCDGVGKGFDEAPKSPHVLEFKTAKKKYFTKLQKYGLQAGNPTHYAQVQLGMRLLKIERAFYFCTHKDSDDIYAERVRLDRAFCDSMIDRASRIVEAAEPPDRIGDSEFWKCKFCDFRQVCHFSKAPEPNCRTCIHSTPVLDGSGRDRGLWVCEYGGNRWPLDMERQKLGCPKHLFIPPLLGPEFTFVRGDIWSDPQRPICIEYTDREGARVYNAIDDETLVDTVCDRAGTEAVFRSREFFERPISTATDYAELRLELGRIPF